MFESFPRPEIGKNNSNYASSLCRSPKLGFLEKGNEYLEYVSGVILPGGGKEGDVGKEGIVEKIRRQRVGTVRYAFFFLFSSEEKFLFGVSELGDCNLWGVIFETRIFITKSLKSVHTY